MPLIELMAHSAGIALGELKPVLEQSTGPTGINFTVGAAFEKSDGKFPSAYGNVAILDCHYVFDYILDYETTVVNYEYRFQPLKRAEALAAITAIRTALTLNNITLCNFGYEIDGVLANQAQYYMGKYDKI